LETGKHGGFTRCDIVGPPLQAASVAVSQAAGRTGLPTPDWIAVDWGTSNVRAWGIGADGTPLFERSAPEGMGKISREDYPGVLARLLGDDGDADVLVCGMAGAKTGWREAGYLEAPTPLDDLAARSVVPEETRGANVRILPGISQRAPGEDVMRGEETQLLGLTKLRPGFSGTVVLPGTHSKWVRLADGRLERFESAMTGELFEVLSTHSVLRLTTANAADGPDREAGLLVGIDAGVAAPERLTSLVFRTRAASLLSAKSADWCAGYLSGVLIGAEVGGHRDWVGDAPVPLIGSPALCRVYVLALERAGARTEIIDAREATLAGLTAARRQLKP
jgi:2-dehydro-3-deoxygalactonokinase